MPGTFGAQYRPRGTGEETEAWRGGHSPCDKSRLEPSSVSGVCHLISISSSTEPRVLNADPGDAAGWSMGGGSLKAVKFQICILTPIPDTGLLRPPLPGPCSVPVCSFIVILPWRVEPHLSLQADLIQVSCSGHKSFEDTVYKGTVRIYV